MKWTKASEKLPKFEELIYVRIDGVIQKLGNFYEDENKKWFFHVSSQGDVPGWEIPADMFGGIEWLCESEQDEGCVPVFDGILQFSKVTFPDAGPVEHLRKLVQEAWEAAKAPDDITEYADCLLCLFAAAGKSGITLDQLVTAATDKLEECKGRKWQRQNDGTYQHIPPATKD